MIKPAVPEAEPKKGAAEPAQAEPVGTAGPGQGEAGKAEVEAEAGATEPAKDEPVGPSGPGKGGAGKAEVEVVPKGKACC
mmetsp:Transcript_106191/g.332209  ORF Transcript_106191/g.332209 Transcript_106191/m.332209 type:complete len:80 (+) Transcript_106191:110-349(+)